VRTEIPKIYIPFIEQTSGPLSDNIKRVAFILLKDNGADHLRTEENLRTTKPREPIELTIHNA
jgi:hypothetical protein